MPPPTVLSFVRHGQVSNPDNIFYGRLPGFGLNDRGRREAQAAGRVLQRTAVAALFSSPLLRARQTAREIIAFHQHLRLRTSRLLTEVFSAYEGHPASEIQALNDDIYSGAAPQFEQPPDICRRVFTLMQRIRKHYPSQHTVAVTHGDIIAFALLHAKGVAPAPANKVKLDRLGILPERYPATGSITTLTYQTDAPDEQPAVSYQKP